MGFTHPMGACRIRDNSETSVVDQHYIVHGFANLFLATVGVIPISIAINPTLTAAVLALEAVDFMNS